MSSQPDSGPPRRGVVGTLLMLPIGLIIVLVLLFYFVSFRRPYFPGELLIILAVLFLGLFAIRSLYWESRRKYWRERLRRDNQGTVRSDVTPPRSKAEHMSWPTSFPSGYEER